jgi:hypothetical protein
VSRICEGDPEQGVTMSPLRQPKGLGRLREITNEAVKISVLLSSLGQSNIVCGAQEVQPGIHHKTD